MCEAMGNPEWAGCEKFSDAASRLDNQEELDRFIGEWTKKHTHYEVMDILQKAGIAAGAVANPVKQQNEPHFKERGFFQELSRDIVGTQLYPGWPIRFSGMPIRMQPAPLLGQHNDYVLGKLLGLSKTEIEQLEREQIIGTIPLGIE